MFLLPQSAKTIKIFFAYSPSQQDEQLRQVLEKQLSGLGRAGVVMSWYQHQNPKTAKRSVVFENFYQLHTADVIVFLVSADFLALIQSQADWKDEINKLKEKHKLGEIVAIPILLYQVHGWQKLLGNFTPLPRNGMPMKSWQNPDAALIDIFQGIEATIRDLRKYQERVQEYRYSYAAAVRQEFPLSDKALSCLDDIKKYLAVKNQDAQLVQKEVTAQVRQEYKQKLKQYQQELDYISHHRQNIQEEDIQKLYSLKSFLGLKDEDVIKFEQSVIPNHKFKLLQLFITSIYPYVWKIGIIGLIIAIATAITINIRMTSNHQAEIFLKQGQAKFEQGDYQGAITDYTQAIRFSPKYVDAYIQRGNAYSYLQNYQAAMGDYTTVINFSSSPIAHMNRAVINCTLGNKQGAIKDYQKAASIFKKQGDVDQTKQAMDRINNLETCLPKR